MKSASPPRAHQRVAARAARLLTRYGAQLTLGGEPTYVPVEPEGAEWSITAVGPQKLEYAYRLADVLIAQRLPGAATFYCPGKLYPGEVNPRWALKILWNRSGKPICRALPVKKTVAVSIALVTKLRAEIGTRLQVPNRWLAAREDGSARILAWVLPLDHDGIRWVSADWRKFVARKLTLLRADGPAGLRLPLNLVPDHISRRALVLEIKGETLHVFLPPLLQKPFLELLQLLMRNLRALRISDVKFEGYIPSDERGIWEQISFTADPGVLEINIPPCATWDDYAAWLDTLHAATQAVGLRSCKKNYEGEIIGTGGGNHIIFGGPSLDAHPFFARPAWISSMLRYWQYHPALAYLFTGTYVGSASQAPRPDECGRDLQDVEMSYRYLASLGGKDSRHEIGETLRHLHTDGNGNTHRSEISFDKFWNLNAPNGCLGLVEFRAIESLPEPAWMSAVALLWYTIAARVLAKPFEEPLLEWGDKLHDQYFLPAFLWRDLSSVLDDLAQHGFQLDRVLFRDIWNWRFPELLKFEEGRARLTVRKALEGWPLLSEMPTEGGSTSRFVDTSMDRIEFVASPEFARQFLVQVQGRELPLNQFSAEEWGAGLRYRRTALYPSLHPGIPPQMPLRVALVRRLDGIVIREFSMKHGSRQFTETERKTAVRFNDSAPACRAGRPGLLTCDLRL